MISTAIDRVWIASELEKVISSERSMAIEAKLRAETPPDPSLAVLYHEIAAQDERHVATLETIAIRYGHTPSRSKGGGVAETLGRLKDKVTQMGSSPFDLLRQDLLNKSDAIHWHSAWVQAFQSIGDTDSLGELTTVLTEDQAHHCALLEGLKRILEQRVHDTTNP
jgi:hypothetical protein